MDDFYTARSSTKPPLPWTNFAPPFSSAEVAGKLAQLGSRLIDSTVKKLSRKFFDNFEAEAAALDNARKETS